MKLSKILASLSLSVAIGSLAFADEAYDIMKKFSTLDIPSTSANVMRIENIEKDGTIENRIMNQYGKRDNGLVSTVFEFKSPASVKDTRVLQAEKTAKEDDRWIYVPSLRTVRRIPTTERYKAFVGCEFTYNDMAIRKVDEDKHEMVNPSVQITTPKGKTYECWAIKNTPLKKSEVEYSYRISYIDKISYLPIKIEYFDKKDQTKLLKTYTTNSYRQITTSKGKYWFREDAQIVNNQTGRITHIWVENPKFDEPLPSGYFNQSWLSTGKVSK